MFYVLVGKDLMAAVLVGEYKVVTLIKDYIDNILKDTNQTVASPCLSSAFIKMCSPSDNLSKYSFHFPECLHCII